MTHKGFGSRAGLTQGWRTQWWAKQKTPPLAVKAKRRGRNREEAVYCIPWGSQRSFQCVTCQLSWYQRTIACPYNSASDLFL